MRGKEPAAAEMIGAIALTSIIVAALAIVGSQWIGLIPTSSHPSANLIIACGNGGVPYDFYCRSGVIGCADDEIIRYDDCANNCTKINPFEQNKCVKRCEGALNCAIINDNRFCNTIFICHNGGDPLEISRLNVFVNDNMLFHPFRTYNPFNITNNTTDRYVGDFTAGEVLRLPINFPPQSVMIVYDNIQTGRKIILFDQKFR